MPVEIFNFFVQVALSTSPRYMRTFQARGIPHPSSFATNSDLTLPTREIYRYSVPPTFPVSIDVYTIYTAQTLLLQTLRNVSVCWRNWFLLAMFLFAVGAALFSFAIIDVKLVLNCMYFLSSVFCWAL